jgi:hypothetical protein
MESSCGEGEGEEEEEGEEEDGDDISQNSNSSKRQRRDSGSATSSNIHINNNNIDDDKNNRNYTTNGMPMELWAVYIDSETDVGLPLTLGCGADTVGHGTPLPLPIPLPGDDTNTATTTRRPAASLISNMVTTSIAERVTSCSGSGSGGATTTAKEIFEYKDWEEIKETLGCASELCDRAYSRLIAAMRCNCYYRRRPVRFYPSSQGGHPPISLFSRPFPRSFPFLLEAACFSGAPQREVQFA